MLNKKIKITCVIFGILFSTVMTSLLIMRKEEVLQRQVAGEVLRFHVLANSDSQEDQNLKLEIKEEILRYMGSQVQDSECLEETKEWVRNHLTELEALAKEAVEQRGYNYPVAARLVTSYFPNKTYGDITFPAGNYEALRVEIGMAQGQNWWCVLYPKLCFYDAVHAVVPEEGKRELEEVLDEEAYDMVTSKTIFRIKWFFF